MNLCTSYDCSDDESEGGIGRKVAIDGSGGVSGHDNDGGVIVNYPRNKRHSTGDVASEVAPFRSSLLARKGSQTQLWIFRSIYRVQHPLRYPGSLNVFMEVTHDVVVDDSHITNS